MKDDYKLIYKVVKKKIDEWNPYSLLPDAPSNEFDIESKKVAKLLTFESSDEQIALVVSKVFSSAFEPSYFTPDDCKDIAFEIRKAMNDILGDG